MKKPSKPTMKDVAKLAGVTQPTVSHVINGTASVSEEVKEKVFKAIKQLGYVPNALAKGLKQRRTNTVGLIIPDIDSGYYAEIAKGIEKTLREQGFITFLCNTFYNTELERLYINTLIQQNVAGIIVGYGLVDKNVYEGIYNVNIPLVVIDDRAESGNILIPSVEINNIAGSMLAVEHLHDVGANRICFASEPLFNRALSLRFEGFKIAMQKCGYALDDKLVFIENNQYNKIEMGYNIGAKILLNGTIDAVFASSDNLAFGIIQRFKEYDIKIPDDMVVVGYDDIPLARLITPSLTTVSQPKYPMAKKGAEILIKLINNETIDEKEYLLEPSLIVRQSTMKMIKKLDDSRKAEKSF